MLHGMRAGKAWLVSALTAYATGTISPFRPPSQARLPQAARATRSWRGCVWKRWSARRTAPAARCSRCSRAAAAPCAALPPPSAVRRDDVTRPHNLLASALWQRCRHTRRAAAICGAFTDTPQTVTHVSCTPTGTHTSSAAPRPFRQPSLHLSVALLCAQYHV